MNITIYNIRNSSGKGNLGDTSNIKNSNASRAANDLNRSYKLKHWKYRISFIYNLNFC